MTTEQELLERNRKKKIKPSDFGPEVEKLYREVRDMWQDNDLQRQTIKQKVNEIALRIKEFLDKNGIKDKDREICNIICDWYEVDLSLQKHIERVLPDDFKRSFDRTTINSPNVYFTECFIKSKRFIEYLEELKNENPYKFGRGGAQDIADLLKKVKDKIEDWADEAGVPLPYQNTGPKDEKKRKIQLRPSEISNDELIRIAEHTGTKQLDKLEDKLANSRESLEDYHYVSDNFDTEEEIVFRLEALDWLLRPITDDKWQRDWFEWCNILENYHLQGGTYASSKSAVDSTLIDPKTGNFIRRKITKEQIDATHDEYLNQMRYMITNLRRGGKFGRQEDDSRNTLDHTVVVEIEKEIDGEWVKTGEKELSVVKYEFTHEQLKPQDEGFNPTVRSILDEMRLVIKENSWVDGLFQRFREKERAFRATRAIELNPVLSDKA